MENKQAYKTHFKNLEEMGKSVGKELGISNWIEISQEKINSWKSTQMLIIDEVSFLSEHLLQKTDKHMRILAGEKDLLFGGCHIVFVGDFFQMLPVGGGQPLFKGNTLQFGAINKAIFLNVSHRFSDDPAYGELMKRFRIGLVTKTDIQNTIHRK